MQTRTQNVNLDIETKSAGQPRPYADSLYHFLITDKSEKPLSKFTMKKFCVGFLEEGYDKDKMPDWASGQIIKFEEIEERVWEYKVKCAFTG